MGITGSGQSQAARVFNDKTFSSANTRNLGSSFNNAVDHIINGNIGAAHKSMKEIAKHEYGDGPGAKLSIQIARRAAQQTGKHVAPMNDGIKDNKGEQKQIAKYGDGNSNVQARLQGEEAIFQGEIDKGNGHLPPSSQVLGQVAQLYPPEFSAGFEKLGAYNDAAIASMTEASSTSFNAVSPGQATQQQAINGIAQNDQANNEPLKQDWGDFGAEEVSGLV